ncbi:MAG: hypothetical protein KZQ82_20230 [Candidatus Thiodiazotropha sp. (ex Lucinoma annulata)]|nr:hypothetical protein [Candidatus Thiodiazotropha sp. (ex Lucinoma annulata)]
MSKIDHTNHNFPGKVREIFAFLEYLGFSVVESSLTVVRYKNREIEVDVYHGRHSCEIGAGITVFGVRYTISEIIKVSNPDFVDTFRYVTTNTPKGITKALEELSLLMRQFGELVLKGDTKFIGALSKQREQWSDDYALEVLAEQLRPQASEAFRQKDYSTAADLYSRIRDVLSTAELKKLNFAVKHLKN